MWTWLTREINNWDQNVHVIANANREQWTGRIRRIDNRVKETRKTDWQNLMGKCYIIWPMIAASSILKTNGWLHCHLLPMNVEHTVFFMWWNLSLFYQNNFRSWTLPKTFSTSDWFLSLECIRLIQASLFYQIMLKRNPICSVESYSNIACKTQKLLKKKGILKRYQFSSPVNYPKIM